MQTNGATVITQPFPAGVQLTLATISCSGASTLRMRVEDPLTAKTVLRDLDLTDHTPDMHPRLVALTLAELIVVSWSELATNPEPVVPAPATPALADAAVEIVHEELNINSTSSRVGGGGEAGVLAFVGQNPSAGFRIGGGLSLTLSPNWLFEMEIAATIHQSYESALGAISTQGIDTGLLVHWRVQGERLQASIGAGLAVGVVTMRGIGNELSVQEGEQTGLWTGPQLQMCAGIRLGADSRGSLSLCSTAGWALVSTVALENEDVAVRIGGPYLGASLQGMVSP